MPKINNPKFQSASSELLRFKNRLRGSRHTIALLRNVRDEVPSNLYNDVIAWIRSHSLYSVGLFNPEYPKSAKRINEVPLLNPTGTRNEFRWAGAYLSSHGDRLSAFLRLSYDFQRALLQGDYSACEQLLGMVEQQFGQSLWLIRNKIAFLQIAEGLEAQKKYTAQIRADASPIVAYIASFASALNEPATHPMRYIAQLMKRLSAVELPQDIAAYFRYYLNPNHLLTVEEMTWVLRCENAGAVVDFYETLLTICQMAFSNGNAEIRTAATVALRPLQLRVNDPRLDTLLFELGGKVSLPQPSEPLIVEAFNAFLVGEYHEAEKIALDGLSIHTESPDLREIAARAAALLPERVPSRHTFGGRILRCMIAIVAKSSTIDEDVNELVKVSLNLNYHPWARALLGFICKEVAPNPMEIEGSIASFSSCAQPELSPLRVSAMPQVAARRDYVSLLIERFGSCPAVAYAAALAGIEGHAAALSKLAKEQRLLLEAESALRRSDPCGSLAAAIELGHAGQSVYQQKAIQLTARSLLALGRVEDCLDFMVDHYIHERRQHMMLPTKEVIDGMGRESRRCYAEKVSLPIVYDIYCRHVDEARSVERGYAYEDFLFAHGVERPSELAPIIRTFDRGKLVYFLRSVCIESVMDCSTAFQSSQEVRDERLNICRLLVELDPENIEVYQSEVKDILRRSTIKKQMRQIEQSKIYVDVESIKKTVDVKMRENFNRYHDLLIHGALTNSIFYIKSIGTDADERPVFQLIRVLLSQNEMDEILQFMVAELRDQFVSSTEHGLDGYLSVRIRHGTLSGQMRRPLEAAHLITQRESNEGVYQRNTYWPERLAPGDEPLQRIIDGRLAAFSAAFDELVQEMRNQWIQVSKANENQSTGLFHFWLDEEKLSHLASLITEDTTYEAFLDGVFGMLNGMLDSNLALVRERLDQEAKTRINGLLDSLQVDLRELSAWIDAGDIGNAIGRARTELQLAIDRIIEWFRRTNSADSEPFGIQDVINIGTESIRTASNGFQAEVNVAAGEPALFPGQLFSSFVDIIFIIFENIVRHSQAVAAPKARVTVTYGEGAIHLHIENDIGPGVETENTRTKIQGIIAAMRENKYNRSITTEGGTGFHKIWKLLRHDLGVTPDLNFGFGDNGRFFVEFHVPLQVPT